MCALSSRPTTLIPSGFRGIMHDNRSSHREYDVKDVVIGTAIMASDSKWGRFYSPLGNAGEVLTADLPGSAPGPHGIVNWFVSFSYG